MMMHLVSGLVRTPTPILPARGRESLTARGGISA